MADLSNSSNSTDAPAVCPASATACCDQRVRQEVLLACREFEGWGVATAVNCQIMADAAVQTCRNSCADCQSISFTVYNQCVFLLQLVLPFSTARTMCGRQRGSVSEHRCPSACLAQREACRSEAFQSCNRLCGNFNAAPVVQSEGCSCTQDRARPAGFDLCEGKTVLEGRVAGSPGLWHSCKLMPDDCKNHRPSACGLYKYCPVDLCAVKNVSCPAQTGCRSAGICAAADGRCYSQALQEGAACSDGISWTHSDRCVAGSCVGVPDRCRRDNVVCRSSNPCLRPTSQGSNGCDPTTGSCVFEHLPEGTPCASYSSSSSGAVVDGTCRSGLCRHRPADLDLCRRVSCRPPSSCHELPRCHKFSGCGGAGWKPEGTACDDGNASTARDRCVEGRCVGESLPKAVFRRLPSCGLLPGGARYSADVPDVQYCREQCGADPECGFFSYGYQTCSIFGTQRGERPDASLWGRPWVLATAFGQPAHGLICFEKTGGTLEPAQEDGPSLFLLLSISPFFVFPLGLLAFLQWKVICRSLRQFLRGEAPPARSPVSPLARSPKGFGRKVAAAPASPKATGIPPAEAVADPRGAVEVQEL